MKKYNAFSFGQIEQYTSAKESRRGFLKTSAKLVAAAAVANSTLPFVHAAENNTIKIALIGCGGRGTGATGQALSTKGPTVLWAMADVFEHRLQASLNSLKQRYSEQINVPPERQFIGLDGFKKAMDTLDKGSVVILATPPAFRPIHFEYAVNKGLHVFMEKSFAVDAPGIRRVLKTGDLAKEKNLKVAGGLMSRHYLPLERAIEQIHSGIIGDVITAYAYRMHGPVGLATKRPNMKELEYQIANYSCFTWLNGSFIVDWLIHNIDVCCWVKNAYPISVQGMGGRQVRKEKDQLFDHYMAEYTFPDGTRMVAQGRHISQCYDFFGDIIHGSNGCAVLGEGIPKPLIYKGHRSITENIIWRYSGEPCDAYQREHDLLFDAIRNDKPYNETERCAKSCLTAIMGRMACESGKLIKWEEAFNSNLELAPGLENYTLDSPPPESARPDENGNYPIAMPGTTKAL
ncbi:MAG: Gfo/Idh/MocA family protein [Verrucomicrobiia bacterium]